MHLSSRTSALFLFTLVIISSFCAANIDAHFHLHRRQIQTTRVGTSGSSAVTSTTESDSEPTTTSSTRSSAVTTTTRAPTTSATPTSSAPETTIEEPSTSPTPTPSTEAPTSTPETPTPTSETVVITATAPSPSETEPGITTTIITVSGSNTISSVITSSPTSTEPTPTDSPSLNGGEKDSGSSGISSSQKKTIIGVVVGIGGAILIGALAVVAWRIWGRKKNEYEDDMYDPNKSLNEASSSGSGPNPFKSTLDQYHNPTRVNTAANF